MANKPFVHPYIPNSVPEVRQEMMDFIGIKTQIPQTAGSS